METTTIKSLHEHIASLAKKEPKKMALLAIDQEGNIKGEISYAELVQKLEAAAGYLQGLGAVKGDRVALAFKNSPELLILSWAAWATGIATVPMDTKRDTGELYQYKLKANNAKVLVAQEGALKDIDPKYLADTKVVEFGGFDTRGDTSQARSHLNWERGLKHSALILFTSGTTGNPKGAKLSLENLVVNADGIRQWLRVTADDCFLVNLPLHHINSTTFCLSTLLAGGSIAIPPGYSNSNFWKQMAQTGATFTSIVQSILFDQLGREKEFVALKSGIKLNRIQIGSAPVVAQTVLQFKKKFGIPLYQGYGQTETALRVTGLPMDISEKLYEMLVGENSIGTAMPWADLRIANEEGKFLGEGEEGELVVRGPALMEGYIGGEKAFCDLLAQANGYFLTGDVGLYRTIEGRKFFFLKGRKRELIIKGGINISPVAVENHLKTISEDIDQAYVVAVADERYGEEIGAVICWKAGVDVAAAKRRLKCKLLFGTPYLSAYETPKYITSMAVEELPTTSTGKVQRTVLKNMLPYERFESMYGLIKTPGLRFTALHRYSRWVSASFLLYTQCWGELAGTREQYEKSIPKQLIILAAKPDDSLAGQIALIRTNLSARDILKKKYVELFSSEVLNRSGTALVCVSICSADYKQRDIPAVPNIPDADTVRSYMPQDPVFKFHQKPKGGQSSGAELVDVIPAGRPDDKSSLGYNMLMKYPEPSGVVVLTEDAPVSNQLIEAVLLIAHDLNIKDVYAYSRPGGLASYIVKREV